MVVGLFTLLCFHTCIFAYFSFNAFFAPFSLFVFACFLFSLSLLLFVAFLSTFSAFVFTSFIFSPSLLPFLPPFSTLAPLCLSFYPPYFTFLRLHDLITNLVSIFIIMITMLQQYKPSLCLMNQIYNSLHRKN